MKNFIYTVNYRLHIMYECGMPEVVRRSAIRSSIYLRTSTIISFEISKQFSLFLCTLVAQSYPLWPQMLCHS
jgi:hypothetical protein